MIENADRLERSEGAALALDCIRAGIEAAHPRRVVRETVSVANGTLAVGDSDYDLDEYDRLLVLGGGNGAGAVSQALEDVLGEHVATGAIVTDAPEETDRIENLDGTHPLPSETGVESTERVLDLARAADERTLVLAVVTGGASALMAAPAEGIELSDLREITTSLLESGADITEINAVRKHLSAVKGGQLARAAAPATVVGLVFSDVVGDDLATIGSGPIAPDDSTFQDAIGVLEAYDIAPSEAVRDRLDRGVAGEISETPGANDPLFEDVHNHVIASNRTALFAARDVAEERGYDALVLSSRIRGEAREVAKSQVAIAEECAESGTPVEPPAVLLSGGETTVTIRGDGAGGPNQEFALGAALAVDSSEIEIASVDTDGIDGPTDAAGALVRGSTATPAEEARDALARNDVYPFLDERDALIVTGPTGTNVSDLRIFVVPE